MIEWIKSKTNKHRKDYGKYNFSIKSEPQFIDSSTTLSLTTYSNLMQNATIPCVYKWSILRNGFKVERPQFRGSSYRCEPGDLGAIIEAEVKSTDSEYGGTAVIHFGPVSLDMNLRKHVEIALNKGQYAVSGNLIQEYEERECQIKLNQQMVKISHVYSDAVITFDFNFLQPKIQCVSKDRNRAVIQFWAKDLSAMKLFKQKIFNSQSKNGNNFLQIKFPTHDARDTFIFAWKGLITKRQLRSSIVLQKLQNFDLSKNVFLDYAMQIQGLKKCINQMNEALTKANQEKKAQFDEIQSLKNEIQFLVLQYTEALGQSNLNVSKLSHQASFCGMKTLQNLQNDNNQLNNRISALTNEIDLIRFQPKIANSSGRVSTEPVSIVKSPFSKKKTQDETQNFISLLQDLSSSRVSEISEIGYIREEELAFLGKSQHNMSKQVDLRQSSLNKSFQNVSVKFNSINSPHNTSFLSIKTEKKEPVFFEGPNNKSIQEDLMRKTDEINYLKRQLERLQKSNMQLSIELQGLKSKEIPKFENQIATLKQQFEIYRRSSDSLNQSRRMEQEMSELNKEQYKVLKKHNDLLTNENAKLSKACEKYMSEARECTKLRIEVMKLRESTNHQKGF